MTVPQRRTATTASISAPTGGWNARDSIANMSPLDAVVLNNFFPTPTDVQLRLGYTKTSVLTTSTGVQTISSIIISGTVATLTTASAHGLSTGDTVSISGATPTEFNGVYSIIVTGSTTFTYVPVALPAGNATIVGSYKIGLTTQINSLMNWAGQSMQKLFAVAGNSLYDVSAPTAVEKVTGLSNDKWQHVNMSTTGENHFLICCNGQDPAMIYDGTNWIKYASTSTAQTISSITHVGAVATVTTASAHGLITGNQVTISGATPIAYNGTFIITKLSNTTFSYTMASTPVSDATGGSYVENYAITGVDSTKLIQVNLFKNFLFFVEEGSLRAWYLPVGQVAGAASQLDFGGYARSGGYLQAMGTWTIDAGQGADDYAVWVTNNGEVIVYTGTNPADPAAWSLEGIWQLGQTFARRCFLKFGGDLLLLTQDGLSPLAAALQSSRLDPRVNLTDKIYYEISREISLYSTNFGWQIIYFARENMLIINIPSTEGIQQYCMHTISKAWCSFSNINATCWEMNFDNIYFGGNGYVAQFWDGYSDAGNNINAQVQQAYSYFDSPGQQKRFTMIRPIFQTDNGLPGILVGINTDFDAQNSLGAVSYNAVSSTLGTWDSATWDNEVWGGNLTLTKLWQGVTGIGYSGGIVMKLASQGIDVHWVSSDYVMERGGVL